jgi:hypothetical protein
MPDPGAEREPGFYWISIDGQEAEVAQWQHEWDQWFVIGREMPLSDEIAASVAVLSGLLLPPDLPAGN